MARAYTTELERQTQGFAGTFLPTSVAKKVSSRSVELACPKLEGGQQLMKLPSIGLWPPISHTVVSTHTCSLPPTHVNTQEEKKKEEKEEEEEEQEELYSGLGPIRKPTIDVLGYI